MAGLDPAIHAFLFLFPSGRAFARKPAKGVDARVKPGHDVSRLMGALPLSDEDEPFNPATIVAHDPDFPEHAVVPPIYQSSLFTFASHAEMRAAFAGEAAHPFYSR